MTPQEINVAVAEEMGWKFEQISVFEPNDDIRITDPNGKEVHSYPRCFDSLDCAAEMEKALSPGLETDLYADHLYGLVKPITLDSIPRGSGAPNVSWRGLFQCMVATAPQRCEAFLRVRGRWPTV